jgi:hypothetical protein
MNSKNILKILLAITTLFAFSNCNDVQSEIEKIDFKTNYKFSSEIENKIVSDTVPWKHQISAADYATKGDYKNALIQWDLAMGTKEQNYTQHQIDSINQMYSRVKATDYIVEQSKKNQIIIINEAHHNSHHRTFTKSLLQHLYDNGYKNLGLEALTNNDSLNLALNKRKYPTQETGYYIRDPQFGNLVREALEIGYKLFAYEQTSGANGKPREIEQAKNIQKFMAQHPNEKVLIHCGFDHALEGEHKAWEKAMAGRLTEYTGINPLTINQVIYSEKSKPQYNHPLLKAFEIKESSVILDNDNNPLKYKRRNAWTDIAVFHPNTKYVDDRPDWLFKNDNKNIAIPLNNISLEFPVMILAFKKGEDINFAIPLDLTEVKQQTQSCNLGLSKGSYTIVVTNGKESIKFEHKVK